MKTNPTRRRALAVAVAATLLLAGCAAGSTEEEASSGEALTEIVEAIPAYPTSFSFDGLGSDAVEILQQINATLIRNPYVESEADPTAMTQDLYDWEPLLAESYDVSEDGLVYTFHLRTDVVSQAGNPLTADDVLYSWERKFGAKTGITSAISLPAITDPAAQIAKVDDHTVTFTLAAEGHGFPFLALITKISGHIYDSTLLKEHATADDPWAVQWSSENGNYGFGAYNIASFRDGEEIVLEANPDYALGEVDIKKITMRVVGDAANRALLLKNGDVDAATQLRPADVADLSTDPNVATYSAETNNFLWTMLNTTAAPLDDPLVRQAFFYAVPYEQIIDEVYKGRADPTVGLLDDRSPGYDDTGLLEQSFDPEKSLELLEEAGVETPVQVSLLMSNAQPDLEEAAIQMQSFAGEAGFEFSIEVVPTATVTERVNAKDYNVRMLRDMSISFESMPYSLLLAYPQNNPARNSTGWGTPEYYAAVQAGVDAGDSLSDEAGAFWNEAQNYWQEGRPQIQVARVQPLNAFSSALTGFGQRSDNIVDWSIVSAK
ncbi:MAG: ABC transporter substrate-binding protein [Microbacteriaceae bacterium]